MTNNIQTLNLERINKTQTRPEEVDLEVVKGKISEFLEKSQNLSNVGMDSLLNEVNEYLVSNLENLHVNYRLKESDPLLYIIHKKQNEYPRLHKLFAKRIGKLVNKFKNEYKKNHRSLGSFELMGFVTNKKKNNNNLREVELLQHIKAVISLSNNRIEESNEIFRDNIITTLGANIQCVFNIENLKNLLSNPNTTIKNLEETADLLLPKNSKGNRLNLPNEFLQEQKNNIKKLEEELGDKKTLEESKYNYYANICYLKSFITYDDAKRKGADADTKYKEANELLDKGNFYSFYSNKENLQKFIEDNCFKPDVLYKKTQDLRLFYGTYFDKDKQEKVFESLDKIIKNLKKDFENSNEKLAAINFFEANCLVLSSGNENDRYFNCRKNAMDYYSKINSNEAKIACLSVGRICNNDLDKDENNILKQSYDNLLKLTETNELYGKAQYECGKYIKNEDKNKAFEYFKNSADKGYNEAKVEVAGYYIEEYNQAKEGSTKEDRRKDIEAIISTLPEEFNEKKAEIYEKIDSYKEAGECYNKLVKEADSKKNYMDNAIRLKKIFIKIGDCFTKLADKIRGKNNNVNNEESKNYYEKANENYVFSGECNPNKFPAIGEVFKIAVNKKKLGLQEEYEYQLKLVENSLQNLKEDEKIHLADLYFELANFYYIGGINRENININKAYEYYRKAVEFGCEEAAIKFLYVLAEAEGNENFNKEEIFNISKKLTTPEAKYQVAYKLRLKYKELAFKLFEEAADSGNVKAKYEVARMLKSGIGVKRNEKKAIKFFEDMIKNNEEQEIKIKSLNELGGLYYNESKKNKKSEKENINKAIKYYEEARDLTLLNEDFEVYKEEIFINLNNLMEIKDQLEFENAKKLINSNKEKEALEIFENLSKNSILSSIAVNSFIEIGDIYAKKNNKEELYKAIEYYNRAIQLSGNENGIISNKLDSIACKIELLDNTEVNTFNNIKKLISVDKQKAINEFKELIKKTKNQNIKINSLIELGDIYIGLGNENSLNIAKQYYLDVNNIYLNSDNMTDKEKNIEIVNSKLSHISKMEEQLKINKQIEDFENAKKLIGTKNEQEAIEIFKNLLNKDDVNQSIKIDSLIALGDIYSEDYKKESFVIARSYYQKVLRNYYENNNKFDEVQNRFIILSNKESVLNYNEETEKSEIEEIVDSTMKYLNKLKITIEEKKQKFEKFANVLKSKISGKSKTLIFNKLFDKISDNRISFINDMLKASNEFFTNSINSVNK